jgi:hypothetical protein
MPKITQRRLTLLPSNPELVLRELDRRMEGHGNGKKTALDLGIDYNHLRSMRAGSQRINRKVAEGLGFKLMWVKVEMPTKASDKRKQDLREAEYYAVNRKLAEEYKAAKAALNGGPQ